jgi:hypothetical protein
MRANPAVPEMAKPEVISNGPLSYSLDLHGKTPKEFREQIQAAAGTDRLPPPPEVDLRLELQNTMKQELRIAPAARGTELQLELEGPGAVTVPGPAGGDEPFLAASTVVLAPGQRFTLPIRRLIYGSRGAIRFAYWTEPGEYTLTVRYRVAISPAPRGARPAEVPGSMSRRFGYVIVDSQPIKIAVVASPHRP